MESLVSISLLVKGPHLASSSLPEASTKQTSTKSPNVVGGDAGRRVVHMGELVVQCEQACRYYVWVIRASFYTTPRPATFSKRTSTFCPPFQQQFPQQQPIPYPSKLLVLRWSGLFCLPTRTSFGTSSPGPTTTGTSRAEAVPERWQTIVGPQADDGTGDAGRLRQQPARLISSVDLIEGASTDASRNNKSCADVVWTSRCLAAAHESEPANKLHVASSLASNRRTRELCRGGIGNGLSAESCRFFFLTITRRHHIVRSLPVLIISSTTAASTASTDPLPEKTPVPSLMQVIPAVHLGPMARAPPRHLSTCPTWNSPRGPGPPANSSHCAHSSFAGAPTYQAWTAPFSSPGTGTPDSNTGRVERCRFPASSTVTGTVTPGPDPGSVDRRARASPVNRRLWFESCYAEVPSYQTWPASVPVTVLLLYATMTEVGTTARSCVSSVGLLLALPRANRRSPRGVGFLIEFWLER